MGTARRLRSDTFEVHLGNHQSVCRFPFISDSLYDSRLRPSESASIKTIGSKGRLQQKRWWYGGV